MLGGTTGGGGGGEEGASTATNATFTSESARTWTPRSAESSDVLAPVRFAATVLAASDPGRRMVALTATLAADTTSDTSEAMTPTRSAKACRKSFF